MKIATQDEKGNPIIIEVPDPEPEPKFWHEEQESKPIQVIISEEIRQGWLMKKQEHDYLGNYPEIAMVLEYVKNLTAPRYQENGVLYIYLEGIYRVHYEFLKSFGVEINGNIVFED